MQAAGPEGQAGVITAAPSSAIKVINPRGSCVRGDICRWRLDLTVAAPRRLVLITPPSPSSGSLPHCCLLCALSLLSSPHPLLERHEASDARNGGIASRSESNLNLSAPESWFPVPIFQNPEEIGGGMAACVPIGLVPLDSMVLWPGGSRELHLL